MVKRVPRKSKNAYILERREYCPTQLFFIKKVLNRLIILLFLAKHLIYIHYERLGQQILISKNLMATK
jgi:hypothetical protein